MANTIKLPNPINLKHKTKAIRILLSILLLSTVSYAQDFTKEVVKIWDQANIPLNKSNITLKEMVDSTGNRISQISEPVLFVYRKRDAKPDGAAVLFCPGGGYTNLSLSKDGEGYATQFFKMGFSVVAILKYRLPDPRIVNHQEIVPLCDAQKGLSLIYQNAKKWQINKSKIATSGSSAGGHLAASLANLKDKIVAPGVKPDELKQAASILLYPVITFNLPERHSGSYNRLLGNQKNEQNLIDYYSMEKQVTEKTPPTFLVHAKDDETVTYTNSVMYLESLKKYQVPNKYIELEKGGHGFAFNFKKTGVDWSVDLEKWLKSETNLFK